jgi:hypothetical protein
MKTSVLLPVIAWLSTALASPIPLETLNYSGIKPPVYPPDGGCIIVARLYRKVDGLRVWDSAPICTPDAIDFPSVTQDYVDHAPPDIQSGTLQWAAYGWIFPEDQSADSIGRPGCVWVDAKLDSPWYEGALKVLLTSSVLPSTVCCLTIWCSQIHSNWHGVRTSSWLSSCRR